jgi:uncharacterized protein (DUF885 family)
MAEFQQLVIELLEEVWQNDPVGATHVGIHRYDDLLPDNDPDAIEGFGQKLDEFKRRFEEVDPATLERPEQLDRRWAIAVLDRALLEHDLRNWQRAPQDYLQSLGVGLHDLTISEVLPVEERLEALLSRLKATPGFLEGARKNIDPSAVPPEWIEGALLVARSTRQFITEVVPQMARQVPALEGEVVSASTTAVEAVEDFAGFVRENGHRAQGDFAIGRERFDFLLQRYHLLDVDSDDLLELGRQWIDEYEREMVEVARQIDPDRSWVEVLETVKDDHPTAEQLRQAYDDETMLAREHCLDYDLITFPEGEACLVEWMPPVLRATSPIAKPWVSPPFEEGLTSKWYITPVDSTAPSDQQRQHLRDNSWAWIRGIAQHEMYPGHHLQLVIAKQVGTPLRKQFWSPVYGEGWGLYTEELFYETGFLAEPSLRLMQLRNGLWRAVRVVVDTGLHVRGMSTQEAARELAEAARLEPRWAESEARLYTARPTYPSSYRVGLSMIFELREAYKAKHGNDYSLKNFHDEFMSYSSLPIAIVREEMLAPA